MTAHLVDGRPPVHIGRVVTCALLFGGRNRRGTVVDGESLVDAVARLFALLRGRPVAYVLVGGIALRQYVESRNTEDIDLILTPSGLRRLPEIRILDRTADFVRGDFAGLQVDVLLTRNRLFDRVRRHYATVRRFAEGDIVCATVEGLVLLKLYALPSLYRQGNFAKVGIYENDIATLLHAYRPPLEPLLRELAPHLSATDLQAIQEILADIARRIERFGRGLGAET
jgi:hypothetical protein